MMLARESAATLSDTAMCAKLIFIGVHAAVTLVLRHVFLHDTSK